MVGGSGLPVTVYPRRPSGSERAKRISLPAVESIVPAFRCRLPVPSVLDAGIDLLSTVISPRLR